VADSPPGGGEKTEAPTPKKLEDSAKKGDVLQSKELGAAMVVMSGALMFVIVGGSLMNAVQEMVGTGLAIAPEQLLEFNYGDRTTSMMTILALPYIGFLFVTMAAAVGTPILLGSLGFRISAMKPKPDKLNPVSGLKRMFGPKGLIELGKSLAKIILLGAIGLSLIASFLPDMFDLGNQSIVHAADRFGVLFQIIFFSVSLGLFVIAGIDVPVQLMQRDKRLRMTKQEVKEENKELEGSPEAKAAQRTRQQQILSQSARKALDEATVMLTNPTHFSIVLRYRPGVDLAPLVLARGRGEVARAMRELADEKSVPMLQYPELTRAIYYTTPVGGRIDERLYLAVATILAFIFRLDADMAREIDRPEIVMPDDLHFDSEGAKIG